ncbi:unnamed protein product [Prunus armeniaca]|uniref:Uncharacterized protein n=1 Tax=Prunus armeniaca TaxID=36596 RepID=A0A6J5UZ71_PRUAR|nr:unnamed protein product [Prunus armeniaca]
MRAVILLSKKLSAVIKQAPLWNEFTCWKKFLESHARRLGTESKKRYHHVVTNFLNYANELL